MMTESFYKKWQKENALVKDPSFDSELGNYRPVNMDGEVLNYDGSIRVKKQIKKGRNNNDNRSTTIHE